MKLYHSPDGFRIEAETDREEEFLEIHADRRVSLTPEDCSLTSHSRLSDPAPNMACSG